MSSHSEEGLDGDEVEGSTEDDVIEWDETVEDHTLAVLEGDLEEDPDTDISRDDLDGREGVAKVNTEKYVTDFEESFEFRGATIDLSVERDGGLNSLEYWSDDADVLEAFDEFLQKRVRSVEQKPFLEPYKFEDVTSDEVAELISVYTDEFEMEGPLPRGSNGQPRMHMLRVTDLDDSSEYREDVEEDQSISAEHRIPGDAKYVIEGLDVSGEKEVKGELEIRPQKHDLGLYTVKFSGEDGESQAYLVNTSLKAIEPEKDDMYPF